MLLNNECILEEIKKKIKFLALSENENTHKHLEYKESSPKRESLSIYMKKSERSQINNLMMCHKVLGKKCKPNPKSSVREKYKIREDSS